MYVGLYLTQNCISLQDLAAERQARTRSLSKSTNTENVPSLRKFMSPKGKLLSRSLIDKTGKIKMPFMNLLYKMVNFVLKSKSF